MPDQTIHVLLIAINDYPVPSHRLNGCVNDLEAMKEYLRERCNNDVYALRLRELKNGEATRQQIIEAFDHFNEAKEGDSCLLFYSGHGSQMNAPEELWQFEKDRLLETIVCYDSRIDNGYDLADKELGYLIWKVTQGKNVHFTAVMDCCHSGTNTRGVNIKCRMTETSQRSKSIRELLGYEHYDRSSELEIYKSDHIQLAAARSDQAAKELEIAGKPRGVFTYCLLETLKRSNALLSYSEALPPVALKIACYVNDQYPQLDINGQAKKDAIFLNGSIKPNSQELLVNYDHKAGKWRLNFGSLHGMVAAATGTPAVIEINGSAKTKVKEVHASFSYLEDWGHKRREEVLPARILEMAAGKLCVGFAPDCLEEGKTNIVQLYEANRNVYFILEEDVQKARYIIHAVSIGEQPVLYLTKKESPRPVFQRIDHVDKTAAAIFFDHVAAVAKWAHVCELNNPVSAIGSNDLEIRLFRIEGEENPGSSAGEQVDHSQLVVFHYQFVNGKWVAPFFRLEVRNRTNRNFHVGALYMGNDFSICQLPINAEAFENLKRPVQWGCQPIEMANEKAYNVGIPEIQETIKLLVSTQDFYLNFFEQPGLEPDRVKEIKREIVTQRSPAGGRSDWKAIHIAISISRPVELKPLAPGEPVEAPNSFNKIRIPDGTGCDISFSTLQMNTRSLMVKPTFLNDPELGPFELTSGCNLSQGLSVIELWNFRNGALISDSYPIQIELNQELPENVVVIPYGYNKNANRYIPVGASDGLQHINIRCLPDMEPHDETVLSDQPLKVYLLKKIINTV